MENPDYFLPKFVKCPHCKTELELEEAERNNNRFLCPKCNKYNNENAINNSNDSTEEIPSYKASIIFIIFSILSKLMGYFLVQSHISAARKSGSHIAMLEKLNSAANIAGTFDVIMIILGLIGLFLFITTYNKRKKYNKPLYKLRAEKESKDNVLIINNPNKIKE